MKLLRPRFAHGKGVPAVVACLLTGLCLSLVLEAADFDPDLFSMGAESLEAATPAWAGDKAVLQDAFCAMNVAALIVASAGICLIAAHRARSALSGDGVPTRLTPFGRWPSREE